MVGWLLPLLWDKNRRGKGEGRAGQGMGDVSCVVGACNSSKTSDGAPSLGERERERKIGRGRETGLDWCYIYFQLG